MAIDPTAAGSAVSASDAALLWHLTYNHYPPLPAALIPSAKAAIRAIATHDDPDEMIDLPARIQRNGSSTVRAADLIAELHLEDFIEVEPWAGV